MQQETSFEIYALPENAIGERLDKVSARGFPEYSRNQLTEWIKEGRISLDGEYLYKPNLRIKENSKELRLLPGPKKPALFWGPQSGDCSIVFENESFLVVNKSPGIVVHPAPGNTEGSLANFLHAARTDLGCLPRCGIVHRLDKGTSGLLLVAKTKSALIYLTELLKNRLIKREYIAFVSGNPPNFGVIQKPIGRHPTMRNKMSILTKTGKSAYTSFYKIKQFEEIALMRLSLMTGRTHQIRVHMSNLHYPLLGDVLYGGKSSLFLNNDQQVDFEYPVLHAHSLSFLDIDNKTQHQFFAQPPEIFTYLMKSYCSDFFPNYFTLTKGTVGLEKQFYTPK